MERKQGNIGVVTLGDSNRARVPLSNLLDILYILSSNIYVLAKFEADILSAENKQIHTFHMKEIRKSNMLIRVLNYILLQLKMSYRLARLTRSVGLWIFFVGGDSLVLPMLTAKLLRKQVLVLLSGSTVQATQSGKDSLTKVMLPLIKIMVKINYTLSDRIIVYSKRLIQKYGLQKYENKISVAPRHFLDFATFKIQKQLNERSNLIGHIGTASGIKGTKNLVRAMPEILAKRDDIKFLIGGDEQLEGEFEEYLSRAGLNGKVEFTGWIPHNNLVRYFNEMKLFVLSSYTEGLPNVMLEAMACGTPVLAVPVGAIPDVIEDGQTGFIMENNSPECIAKNIIRALNHPNLEQAARNARALVKKEFTYEKAVERYRQILKAFPGKIR